MRQMIDFAERNKLPLPKKEKELIESVKSAPELNQQIADNIKALWKTNELKKIWDKRNEYSIMTCADFYLQEIDRIIKPDYVPSQEDILRSKMRTTGVIETIFETSDIEFTLVDVGGQRSERRKWLHVFENVTAVIFLAALDAYDMMLEEAPDVNRMDESLRVFNEITSSTWFRSVSFILFLNKSDLFAEKIKKKSIKYIISRLYRW